MDELAAELGMDPLELRQRNWISHAEFPYTTITGLTYDSGNYEAATARATELFGYDALRREQAERRQRAIRCSSGSASRSYTEMGGLAPSRWFGEHGYSVGGWETASVRLLPTGRVEVIVGTSPHGQGHETTFSQIIADTVGVPFDDVDVVHGDTDVAPWGLDTYGSRSIVVGGDGGAAGGAEGGGQGPGGRRAPARGQPRRPGVRATAGSRCAGTRTASRTIQDVAFAAFAAHDLPPGADPVLLAEATVDPTAFSYPHGTHLCAVEVDTATGLVKVRSYVAVDDVGTVINPMIVDGQVHGGVTQGLAQALYEEAVYDAGGNLVTGSLVDYLVPSAADVPPYVTDRTETPATTNPLGVKGAGEAGTIGSTPAVVNAVVDALRPYGVTDIRMPCTPAVGTGRLARRRPATGDASDDPAPVRLRPAAHRRRGGRDARRERQREDPGGRAEPAARSSGCGWPTRTWWWT